MTDDTEDTSFFGRYGHVVPEDFFKLYADMCMKYSVDLVTSDMVQMFMALKEFSVGAIGRAYIAYLGTPASLYFPKPYHLRELIETTTEGKNQPAVQAWDAFRRAMSRYGYRRSIAFPDRRVHYAIENMGGWVALCQESTEQTMRRKQEFINFYVDSENVNPAFLPEHVRGEIEMLPALRSKFDKSSIIQITMTPPVQITGDRPPAPPTQPLNKKEYLSRLSSMVSTMAKPDRASSASYRNEDAV